MACPFKTGDWVIYRPSVRGRGLVIMTDLEQLKAGQKYKVARIDDEEYLVLEGFENSPGGGLHCEEFGPVP